MKYYLNKKRIRGILGNNLMITKELGVFPWFYMAVVLIV